MPDPEGVNFICTYCRLINLHLVCTRLLSWLERRLKHRSNNAPSNWTGSTGSFLAENLSVALLIQTLANLLVHGFEFQPSASAAAEYGVKGDTVDFVT
ncbi:MAG: hypothetical protein ACI9BW_003011 [Gammaproteobacteria bacterium]|jgi:hypothetical protein